MLRIAARYADGWSSWGGYGVETEDDFFAITARRCTRFDDLCVENGRDPAGIRHSIVCFPPLTPWQSPQYFADMVGRFREIGIDEFVLYRPRAWRDGPFTLFAADVDDLTYISYDADNGAQHVARWPDSDEYLRTATTPTSLGPREPVRRLLA